MPSSLAPPKGRRKRRASFCSARLPRVDSGVTLMDEATGRGQEAVGRDEELIATTEPPRRLTPTGLMGDLQALAAQTQSDGEAVQPSGVITRKRRRSLGESSDSSQGGAPAADEETPASRHKVIFRSAAVRGRRSSVCGAPLDVGCGPVVVRPEDLEEWHRMHGEGTMAWGEQRTDEQRQRFQRALDAMEAERTRARAQG